MSYTISTHVGHKLSAAHNRRDESSIKDREHIDRTKKHEVWKDEKVTAAYKRIFDPAVKEYNDKQKRKDRQIKNYYQQVKSAAQKHPVYEMIIAVGNADNPPPTDTAKDIMRQFVTDWQKNNPNLELIGAYYHADERGVPHCHLDFIPIAKGFQRGLQVQASYTKALEQQGYTRTGRKSETPQILWQRAENSRLERLCRERGLEVEHTQRGQGLQHLSVEQYKEQQRLRNQQHQIEQQRQQQRQQQQRMQQRQQELDRQERQQQPLHLQALYKFLTDYAKIAPNDWRTLQHYGSAYDQIYQDLAAKKHSHERDPQHQRQKKSLSQQVGQAQQQQRKQQRQQQKQHGRER